MAQHKGQFFRPNGGTDYRSLYPGTRDLIRNVTQESAKKIVKKVLSSTCASGRCAKCSGYARLSHGRGLIPCECPHHTSLPLDPNL